MVSDLKVTIKGEDKKLEKNFLIYETYTTDEEDPVIKDCINEVLKNFDGEPEDILVKIKLEVK